MKETTEKLTVEEQEEFKQAWLSCTGTLLSVLFSKPEYDLEKSPAGNAIKNTLLALFADVCKMNKAWKARVHNVVIGEDPAFLLVLNTPDGQIFEHIEEKYWAVFEVTEKTVTDKEAWEYSKAADLPFEEAMRRFASLI